MAGDLLNSGQNLPPPVVFRVNAELKALKKETDSWKLMLHNLCLNFPRAGFQSFLFFRHSFDVISHMNFPWARFFKPCFHSFVTRSSCLLKVGNTQLILIYFCSDFYSGTYYNINHTTSFQLSYYYAAQKSFLGHALLILALVFKNVPLHCVPCGFFREKGMVTQNNHVKIDKAYRMLSLD